jgi:hypothetical protein
MAMTMMMMMITTTTTTTIMKVRWVEHIWKAYKCKVSF